MNNDNESGSVRRWFHSRTLLYGLITGVLLLIVARLSASYVLQWYVNDRLDTSPEYAGQVGDIDISLWRGAYSMEDIEIIKTAGAVPVPLFAAAKVEFSVLWRALLNGAVVGEVVLHEPQINIVDSNDAANRQTGADGRWFAIFDSLFPLLIDRIAIRGGQLHFRNYDAEPAIDIFLSELDAEAGNLSNSQALTDSRIARVQLNARAMELSELTVGAAFDQAAEAPTFDLNLKLLQLPIMQLDNFISTYAPFDVEAGTVDVVSELAAREGALEGYVKPIVYNLDVFKWSEDIAQDRDNPVRALWEGLVGFVAELLENQPQNQLASNIPLQGDISEPGTNVFVAVANVFRNAFVEAYQANLENAISLFIDDEGTPVTLPEPLGEPAPYD